MGCASSVQTKENCDVATRSSLKTKKQIEENEVLTRTSNWTESKDLIESNVKFRASITTCDMEVKGQDERIQGDGSSSAQPSQEGTNGVIVEEQDKKEEDTSSTKEETDFFVGSLKPISPKEHATQKTLNFVYKHGSSSTPSHLTASFPGFANGNYGTSNSGRYDNNRRRPSGVPPPARELQPGDFLYKKTLNAKTVVNMTEEDEECDS